ncbi:MAG: hypothetical protein ACJ754_20490 [Pyrinomonadaceae bacterium]|jgi:hypothetical protein
MAERKDLAGRDDERQVRGRKGPSTQARSEKKRRPASKGGATTSRSVPKVGKRDPARGDTSGDGLH